MKAMDMKDQSLQIGMLEEWLEELHEKNIGTLNTLGVPRPPNSRKLKTAEKMIEEAKKTIAGDEEAAAESTENESVDAQMPPRGGRGGRGGLLDSIAARGGGGRAGLLDGIAKARGRGRGGRAGLLEGIAAARGRGAGRNGDNSTASKGRGGRGDLMAAIAARGSGRGRGSAGGRGDLMAAIAARGGGG